MFCDVLTGFGVSSPKGTEPSKVTHLQKVMYLDFATSAIIDGIEGYQDYTSILYSVFIPYCFNTDCPFNYTRSVSTKGPYML